MPVLDPMANPPKAGPGSVMGAASSRRRVKKKKNTLQSASKSSTEDTSLSPPRDNKVGKDTSLSPPAGVPKEQQKDLQQHQQQFLGQDLLEWDEDHHSAVSFKTPKEQHSNAEASSSSKHASKKDKRKHEKRRPRYETKDPSEASHKKGNVNKQHYKLLPPGDAEAIPRLSTHQFYSRHALALDTRYLQSDQEENDPGASICQHYQDFLATLAKRGATPCLLAVTKTPKATKTPNRMGVEIKIVQPPFPANVLTPIPVAPATQFTKGNALPTPFFLKAEKSWRIVREMVDSIVDQDSEQGASPLDVTLLVTDRAFFCDTEAPLHVQAAERFGKNVASLFHQSLVGSIQIVVAKTESLALEKQEAGGGRDEAEMEGKQDVATDDSERSESSTSVAGNQPETSAIRYDRAFTECVNAIQAKFDELELEIPSATFAVTGRLEQSTPINLSITVIPGCPAGFKYLSRQWIRESLPARSLHSRLHLDLPRTMDGTQCTVSFDASYQIFPYPLGSVRANEALSELQQLSESNIEVLQLLPLLSVDSSLLYGIPMMLRAGFENDMFQYQETVGLVASLLRFLQEREQALLLRTSPTKKSELTTGSEERLFLLLAQEVPNPNIPSTGLLYRYAHADDFLAEASKPSGSTIDQDVETYIEEAMESLDCSPFNPFDGQWHEPAILFEKPTLAARSSTARPVNDQHVVEQPGSVQEEKNDKASQAGDTNGNDPARMWDGAMEIESHRSQDTPSEAMQLGKTKERRRTSSKSSVWNDKAGVGARGSALNPPEDDDETSEDDAMDLELLAEMRL